MDKIPSSSTVSHKWMSTQGYFSYVISIHTVVGECCCLRRCLLRPILLSTQPSVPHFTPLCLTEEYGIGTGNFAAFGSRAIDCMNGCLYLLLESWGLGRTVAGTNTRLVETDVAGEGNL